MNSVISTIPTSETEFELRWKNVVDFHQCDGLVHYLTGKIWDESLKKGHSKQLAFQSTWVVRFAFKMFIDMRETAKAVNTYVEMERSLRAKLASQLLWFVCENAAKAFGDQPHQALLSFVEELIPVLPDLPFEAVDIDISRGKMSEAVGKMLEHYMRIVFSSNWDLVENNCRAEDLDHVLPYSWYYAAIYSNNLRLLEQCGKGRLRYALQNFLRDRTGWCNSISKLRKRRDPQVIQISSILLGLLADSGAIDHLLKTGVTDTLEWKGQTA